VIARFNSTAGEIAGICGGEVTAGVPGAVVRSISSDSRETGDDTLFVPLAGERYDGHDFISGLAEDRKISAFLTMKDGFADTARSAGVTAVTCPDTLHALGSIASFHRDRIDPVVIGITGTNGKTTTRELTAAILGRKYRTLKNIKNYNNEIGVPFTLLALEPSHEMAVVEMGMNHSGELDRLSKITKPDLSVITNVGEGHLEFLGSVDNVALSKSEIMHGMKPGGLLVLNRDTDCFDLVNERAGMLGITVKTFGLSDRADVSPESYRPARDGITVTIKGKGIYCPLYGVHNLYNILAAVTAAMEYDVPLDAIADALRDFKNVGGRSHIIERKYTVLDDTYNSNPLSSRYALRSAGEIFPGRRKIAVLSDMKELGGSSEQFHAETGREVRREGFDMLLLWGDMSDSYAKGAIEEGMSRENVIIFDSKNDISVFLRGMLAEGDIVLVKGSRSMKMEEIVRDITQ